MRTPIKVAIVLCVCSLAIYVGWLYLTHFYYRRPHYILGMENRTPNLLREVVLTLSPTGRQAYGLLAGQSGYYMDQSSLSRQKST